MGVFHFVGRDSSTLMGFIGDFLIIEAAKEYNIAVSEIKKDDCIRAGMQ